MKLQLHYKIYLLNIAAVFLSIIFLACEDRDHYSSLLYAVNRQDWAYAKKMVSKENENINKDADGINPLIRSIELRNYEFADYLLNHGADVDYVLKNKNTPLLTLAACRDEEGMSFLLSRGANPNAVDRDGQSALMLAFINYSKDEATKDDEKFMNIFLILYEYGADFTIKRYRDGKNIFDLMNNASFVWQTK